jgi:hypothetical protein
VSAKRTVDVQALWLLVGSLLTRAVDCYVNKPLLPMLSGVFRGVMAHAYVHALGHVQGGHVHAHVPGHHGSCCLACSGASWHMNLHIDC